MVNKNSRQEKETHAKRTNTDLLSYWNCTASSFSFILVKSRSRTVSRRLYLSRRCGNQCCESGSSLTCMFERANQTYFYLLPTSCVGFAPYGTCIHSSLQYANLLRAPIIRAGSVCAARHERTCYGLVCARCHPAPGSVVRAQCTPIWARRCHPQCHRQTHCRPLRDVTTHRRSA